MKKGGNALARKKGAALGIVDDTDMGQILDQTIDDMTALGTWKKEFAPVVKRYAQLRVEFDLTYAEWVTSGAKKTEPYTNKAGATNIRRTALSLEIEKMRAELLVMENELGLTPQGLRRINDEMKNKAKKSKLAEVLEKLEN